MEESNRKKSRSFFNTSYGWQKRQSRARRWLRMTRVRHAHPSFFRSAFRKGDASPLVRRTLALRAEATKGRALRRAQRPEESTYTKKKILRSRSG